MSDPASETLLSFPKPIHPLRHARSTILLSSMAVIRATDYGPAWLAALSNEHREVLTTAVAGTWIPTEIALAHYTACDSLHLPIHEQVANGGRTFDRAGKALFGTMLKLAKEAGVTPWTLLAQLQRFWDRGYDGGGVAVIKTGPKDARMEFASVPLLESPYFRNALRGLSLAALRLFASSIYMTEKPGARAAATVTFRVQWA